jgi:hypothetical protein
MSSSKFILLQGRQTESDFAVEAQDLSLPSHPDIQAGNKKLPGTYSW